MFSYNKANQRSNLTVKPLTATRLLDQVCERLRYMHYSLQTEKTYVYWVKFFVKWHGRNGTMRHPKTMGRVEVEAFLTMLATERRSSTSTNRQALSALLFLYKEVLGQELPWLQEIGRPVPTKRIPCVLTRDEVQRILSLMQAETGLLARLLYGTGMRRNEALSLRVKDVDFERHAIVVREAKGGKDRVVMLPTALVQPLCEQLSRARTLWAADRAAEREGVLCPTL